MIKSSVKRTMKGGQMKETLKPGIEYELKFLVPENKTVPNLYPEATEFQVMPNVLATGYLVGLFEWACIQAINPHIDWPNEQTVGTMININHTAATPPGLEVSATVRLVAVEEKKLVFELEANDGIDTISKGTHERFIINAEKFGESLKKKKDKLL
jgi:fluoroacetyl-CoA thioesterase